MYKFVMLFSLIKKYYIDITKNFSVTQTIEISTLLFCSAFVIDYYNFPSKIITQIPGGIGKVVVICLAIFIVAYVLNSKIIDLIRVKNLTTYDYVAFVFTVTASALFLVYEITLKETTYKQITLVVILVTLLVQIVYRSLRYNEGLTNKSRTEEKNFDLKEIINSTFKRAQGKPVLIAEKDVDYDLLKRESVINHIYQSIVSAADDETFVIGVVGEWGSGKTTVINNVKRMLQNRDDIAIIDDFDPWVYGTETAMLNGMYDAILNSTSMRFDSRHKRKLLKDLSKVVVSHKHIESVINVAFDNLSDIGDFEKNKRQIENYLESEEKTIIFVIDNIDRASAENVLFLFKLIGTIFDLPKIMYILAYDKKRINEIFSDTLKINPKYIEKIVQQEVHVPKIQSDNLFEIYAVCMENVLKSYGVNAGEIKDCQPVFELVIKQVKNLREFKRLINSAFSIVFTTETILSRKELLALEVIRFLSPDLYGTIYNNRKYFISYDKITDKELWKATINSEQFNRDGKQFFDDLFKKYEEYKELLGELFPYVKRYINNSSMEPGGVFFQEEYKNVSNRNGICSGKYFDLYFSYGSNNYAIIADSCERFLVHVNNTSNYKEVEDFVRNVLCELSPTYHREFFEKLQNMLSKVSSFSIFHLSNAIFYNLPKIDNGVAFVALSARRRAIYIVAKLLSRCDINDVESFAQLYKNDFSRLDDISQLVYWLRSEMKENTALGNNTYNRIEEMHKKMIDEVVMKKVDLYDDKYYRHKNIWGLIRSYNDTDENLLAIKEYIQAIISKDNIYRLLWDLTTTSIGSIYRYYISRDSFQTCFNNNSVLEDILKDVSPKTEDESFVLSVYNEFRYGDENDIDVDERGIYSTEEKRLIL